MDAAQPNPAVQQAAAAAANDANFTKTASKLNVFRNDPTKDLETPKQWLKRAIQAKAAAHWNDADALAHIGLALAQDAKVWFETLELNEDYLPTWDYFVEQFKYTHCPELSLKGTLRNTEAMKQLPGETIQKYFTRVRAAVDEYRLSLPPRQLSLHGLPENVTEEQRQIAINYAREQIVLHTKHLMKVRVMGIMLNGLLPVFQEYLSTQNHGNNPETAARLLTTYETDLNKKVATTKVMPVHIAEVNCTEEKPIQNMNQDQYDEIDARIEAVMNRRNQRSNSNQQNRANQSTTSRTNNDQKNSSKVQCLFCKKYGHVQVQCRSRKAANMPCLGKDNVPYYPKGEPNPMIKQNKPDFQN